MEWTRVKTDINQFLQTIPKLAIHQDGALNRMVTLKTNESARQTGGTYVGSITVPNDGFSG